MGLDDSLGDRQTEAGALDFGGEERLEDTIADAGSEAGSVVGDRQEDRGLTEQTGVVGLNGYLDGRGAGGERVFEDVAKDLGDAERIDVGDDVAAVGVFDEPGLLVGAVHFEMVPGFAPDVGQRGRLACELDGCGVTSDVFEEVVKVVLSGLYAIDQIEGFGPVGDLEREHFEAGLAALECVAAFVSETGDHLADGSEAFGVKRAFLGVLESRDVLADDHECGRAFVVGEEACVPDHESRGAVLAEDWAFKALEGLS